MGLCLAEMAFVPQLLLAFSLESLGNFLWGGIQAVLGLGLVIFVHELGHFAVAKWCGVQCDKFMVGFDIGGYKIGRQWGDTYYGIGILPLGGYVKMMGQDDDPSKFEEQARESQAAQDDPNSKAITGPSGETLYVDRRSYMAKSVPQRMAIISAGVIMNVIFAFIFAFIAFGMGVPRPPVVALSTSPGGAAWEANLRTGDRLTRVGDIKNPTYEAFQGTVLLGDLENGFTIDVQRANGDTLTDLQLVPRMVGPLPRVGLQGTNSLTVNKFIEQIKNTPTADLQEGFQNDDVIVAINGVEVNNYAKFFATQLPLKADPITYTVLRGAKASPTTPTQYTGGERVEITVEPNPLERMGIVPVLGPIVAVQQDSPAETAGLQPGDQLLAINGFHLGTAPDGAASWDSLTLDHRLAELATAGETALLQVQRGEGEPIEITLQPRIVSWDERPAYRAPIAIPALGIACPIKAEVAAIVAGSPAELVDLQPGDKILQAELFADDKPLTNLAGEQLFKKPVPFDDTKEKNWPYFITLLQNRPANTQVKLTVRRGDAEHVVSVGLASSTSEFAFARGIPLNRLKEMRSAGSMGEQATMAYEVTTRNLTMVYSLIRKIFEGQVPSTVLGGPLAILDVGANSANEGIGTLLLFLTMLSANLAVLNFLPIPVLDGGHMVFLLYEGIKGRPAGERVQMTAQLVGMVLLLGLMAFVFGLDLNLIDRGL